MKMKTVDTSLLQVCRRYFSAVDNVYSDNMSLLQDTNIAQIEQALCMLACWVEDPNGDNFKKHLARIPDFIWVAEDGIKMQVRRQFNSITNLPNSCRKIR